MSICFSIHHNSKHAEFSGFGKILTTAVDQANHNPILSEFQVYEELDRLVGVLFPDALQHFKSDNSKPFIYKLNLIKAGHFSVCLPGQRSDIGGMFSCFGNAFGCKILITCGGGNKKKSNGKVCNLSSDDSSSVVESLNHHHMFDTVIMADLGIQLKNNSLDFALVGLLLDWLIFNIFYKLEEKIVDWMSKLWKVATVGPTLPSMYLDKRLEIDKDYSINIFEPKTGACMNWLNGKPIGSVVYVAFGSVANPVPEQMEELAWGLKGINCYFLCVMSDSMKTKLPNKFIEEISDQGLIVSWCPQLEVLAHESIGCFVSHCGLHSVMEAMSFGVPMVGMPQWIDQQTNGKFVDDVWGSGIRVLQDENVIVGRNVLEKAIKEIMEGDKGKVIKKNVMKWKELAKEAVDEGGSSDININEFVAKVLCCS
ncbi:hypothetical protein EZV62_007376 [Acer yangbiense]|uniref:Glycosyltransferase n=1 Tax=Acer yangbiense TaxID=1000413 RepID=A0A5C7IAJ5_9ROSI|nr:hypothetical protein EZV62_007376 [Acer yangbiense]